MKLLCLDLSTNAGWALLNQGQLIKFGNIRYKVVGDHECPSYPRNYIKMANDIASECWNLIYEHNPDFVIVEETNKGKNRYWQKQLEFIHFAFNSIVQKNQIGNNVRYIDTSEWRSLLGLKIDKEQRAQNNEVKKQREDLRSQLEAEYDKDHSQNLGLINQIPKVLARKRAQKDYLAKREEWVKEKIKPFRSKINGKATGKIGVKNLSVDYVNGYFHTQFKKKDNDIADAICLGLAFEKKISLSNNR